MPRDSSGSSAAPGHQKKIPADLTDCAFSRTTGIAQQLRALYADIFTLLEEEFRRARYLGPANIDAFFFAYRAADGKIRAQTGCRNVNPRSRWAALTVE